MLALFTDGLTESGLDRTDLLGLTGVRSLFAASTDASLPAAVITRRLIDRIEENTKVLQRFTDDEVFKFEMTKIARRYAYESLRRDIA